MSGDHNMHQKDRSFLDDRRDDIIYMARQAGLCTWFVPPQEAVERFERFYALATAAEREACAKVLDENADVCRNGYLEAILRANAVAIRARGQA